MTAEPKPVSRDDLLRAFASAADEIGGFFAGLDATTFTAGDTEHWSPAHHVDHLIRSNGPVAGGLSVARGRLLPLPAQHRPRTYAEIRGAYRAGLAAGARASGRWLPQPEGTQLQMTERYASSLRAVHETLGDWTDAELDAWAMPHPVLGVLSVREMLYFTLYHNRHHADGVRAAQEQL